MSDHRAGNWWVYGSGQGQGYFDRHCESWEAFLPLVGEEKGGTRAGLGLGPTKNTAQRRKGQMGGQPHQTTGEQQVQREHLVPRGWRWEDRTRTVSVKVEFCPYKRYVEVLTPSTSECDPIRK